MTGRRYLRVPVVAALAITASYAVLGLVVFSPLGIYSSDIGVKFVQARALADARFRSLDLAYPGAFLDPAREFFPIRPPFVIRTGDETQAIFSPASAVLQAAPAAAAGLRGLIIVSLVSAAVTLLASSAMAPPGQKTAVVLAVGVGSPLWLYAVLGWEHAPAVALSTASFAVALRSRKAASAAVAGMLIGAAALLRDEVLLLIPGLLVMTGLRYRSARPVVTTAVIAVAVLLAGLLIDVMWFERPPAAHLRHAVDLVLGTDAVGTAAGDLPVLEQMSFRSRYETVIHYWLLGYGNDFWVLIFSATLLAALLARRFSSSAGSLAILAWVAGVVVLAAMDAWEVATAPKWLAGLHRVAPYLVFALLPPPAKGRDDGWQPYAIVAATALYVVAAMVATNTTGGKSLGPRLLLPLLPLLAVAAMMRIAAYLRASAALERVTGYSGVLLVALAAVIHLAGAIPAYHARNREDAAPLLVAQASSARVIVTDHPHTAQMLLPLYYRKVIFLADSHEARAKLGALLADAKVPEVLLMSERFEPATRLSPLKIRESDKFGRMFIQYWGRVGRDLK